MTFISCISILQLPTLCDCLLFSKRFTMEHLKGPYCQAPHAATLKNGYWCVSFVSDTDLRGKIITSSMTGIPWIPGEWRYSVLPGDAQIILIWQGAPNFVPVFGY
ncbi:hypothetical protein Dimus_016193 [Dionaea muscipula]